MRNTVGFNLNNSEFPKHIAEAVTRDQGGGTAERIELIKLGRAGERDVRFVFKFRSQKFVQWAEIQPVMHLGEETMVMMDLITALAAERSVILVEHKMKLVMGICERLLVLHHGEFLAEGTPAEIKANDEVRRVYLGQG